MVMKKKGVSDVVSTVLIILLVVAAVAIVGAIVLRTINNASTSVDTSVICQNLQVVPTKCVYNSTGSQPAVLVQRKAEGGEFVLSNVTITYTKGSAVESQNYNAELPGANEVKSFVASILTSAAFPDSVKVASYVKDSKGKIILCSNSQAVACTLSSSIPGGVRSDVSGPIDKDNPDQYNPGTSSDSSGGGSTAPSIAVHPASQTKNVGESVTFSVTATGNPAPSYQWRENGVNIAGATSSSYTKTGLLSSDSGKEYTVNVSNSAGSVISNVATLTVIVGSITGSAGPNNGSIFVSDASIGSYSWTSPEGVQFDDSDNYASVDAFAFGGVTNYLKASDFGFSIPAGATITGIEVVVKKRSQSLLSGRETKDNSVKLVKSGVIGGNEKASSTIWNNGFIFAYTTYGSSSDLWGLTWTPSEINDANFGIVISAKRDSGNSANDILPEIDHIKIIVHYTTPSP